ncbi:hypothetical protein D3C76_1370390 [compost metagenome]
MRCIAYRRNIHHPQQRVTWTFNQHQLGLLRQRLLQRLFIPLIDKQHAVSATLAEAIEQPVAAAVAIMRRHQQIAGLQQYGGHQMDRRHPAPGHHRTRTSFQLCQRTLHDITRRVTTA